MCDLLLYDGVWRPSIPHNGEVKGLVQQERNWWVRLQVPDSNEAVKAGKIGPTVLSVNRRFLER
ncbi:MAG: hypothetical protein ACE5HC_13330 [Candidatus Binatia bacterium]